MKKIIKRLCLLLLLLTAILTAHADPVASINENFDASSSIPAGWTQKQVAGDKAWYVPSFNGNNYAAMTGFKGTAPFDQWLISPAIDMSKVSKKVLTFDTQVNGYGSAQSALKVFVLTAADPTTAKTTQLNPTLATAPASGYSDWANSGELDLSAFSGIIYIGFEYTSPVADNYATWCVDNVKLNAEGGSTPDPTPTPTPSGDFKGDFNSFNNGQPLSKPYGRYTNNTGWTATNAIILGGGENDANPIFKFIGAAGTLAPTLNGKTSAPGSLVSPALTGSIKTLTFKYGFAFNDSKCQFTVNVKDAAGNVIKSEVVTLDKIEKAKAYDFSLDVNYNGNFTIEIINNCYSQIADKNKDRVSIWNLTWTDINDKTFVYNNIQFEVFENSDSCYVIGGGSPELVIPATAINPKNNKTYKVTAIGSAAFKGTSLNSITIPEGVTSIWNDAFNECQSLTSVKMPKTLKYIGVRAFYNCSKLNNISLRNTKSCGNEAFSGCESLTVIDLEGMASIGNSAFYGCASLTDINMKNITSLGYSAFRGCTGLTSLTIPNSVTSIGEGAFWDCSGLTSVTFNAEKCTHMGSGYNPVFNGCRNLTTLTIGDKVMVIPNYAFCDCSGLTSVTIPNSVTSIGNEAFWDCSGLTSLTIGNSVASIDNSAFFDCSKLTSLTIPNSVTSIGNSAFGGCSGLTSLTIPNSVTSIGEGAFWDCSGLTSVTFNAEKCTHMGSGYNPVFNGCRNLTTLTIGDKVMVIPNYAFCDCSGLTSVTIPNSVTSIGNEAFWDCSGLTSLTIGNSVASIDNSAFFDCSKLTSLTIPNSVTSIGNSAFGGCSGLTSLTIGNSVTSIGGYAFSGCSGLTSVTIPNSVTSIGGSAFSGCSGLTSVVFNAENCTKMGYYFFPVFAECSKLSTLTTGEKVTTIPAYAFMGCTALAKADMNSVSNFGEEAFSGCTGLKSVSMLKAKSVDASVFKDCNDYETLVLPYEWGADFKMTLSGTTQLRTLYIGENTASIPNKTFVNNKYLFEVYSNAATPPSIGTATFGSETYSYATLYVPQGCVDAYKAATGWSKFEDIQELPFQIVVKDKKVSVDRTKSILVSASVTPASSTSSPVKWYSLDDEIATVTTDGVVTGMAEGGVTILAYCDGITAPMKVIVKKFDGVEDVMADDPTELSEFDVYNLQGIRVRTNCTKEQLSELSHGIYILVSPQGRKKVII